MTRTRAHLKDGVLLQPNENSIILANSMKKSREGKRSSPSLIQRLDLEAKATVTRYHQSWTFMPDTERIILAKMTVDYHVTNGLYNSGFKSIVDSAKSVDLSSVRVTDPINNSTLYHEITEGYDFTFVRWWFDPPLSSGNVATTVVEYKILGGVENCRYGSRGGDERNNTTVVACQESFGAPWANYWSIPVSNIKYEFHLPPDTGNFSYEFVENSLALLEPSPCCLSHALVSPGDGETAGPFWSQSFTSDELAIGVENPRNVRFGWAIEVPGGNADLCRITCDSKDGGTNSLLWLLFLIPVFALLLALLCVCWRRRHFQQSRQKEENAICEMKSKAKSHPVGKAQDSSSSNLSTQEQLCQPLPAPPSAPKLGKQSTSGKDDISAEFSSFTDNAPNVPEPEPKVSLCTVCLVNEINTVILPCAHRAACTSCAEGLSTCPICRATIKECIRTFDA